MVRREGWSIAALMARTMMLGLLLAALSAASGARAQTAGSEREAAVLEARAGRTEAAIVTLRGLFEAGSTDPLTGPDLLTLLQQNGRPEEALAVLARLGTAPLPSYAQLAATRAARDARRWAQAEALARQGLGRFPEETVWPILLALILTDAGRPAESLAVLRTPRALAAPAAERATAEAYARARIAAAAAAAVDAPREAAVVAARAGRTEEALATLRQLRAAHPNDADVRGDLVAVLAAAGRHAEAAEVALAPGPPLPDYALSAATRALRDGRDFAGAEALARQGLRRFPGDQDWLVLLGLILTDAGRPQEALALLRGPGGRRLRPLDRLLAEGYAEEAAGRAFPALRAYADAARLAPANAEARAGTARLLRGLGGPHGAAGIVDAPPPIAEGVGRMPLAAEQAAARVRWGADLRPPEPERRFDGTDRALRDLDDLLARNPDPALRRQLRLDRVVALRDRVRMAEAVAEADALAAQGPLPGYVRQARADALLYLRRPEAALADYLAVLEEEPGSITARSGAFYAAVEAEDFRMAFGMADRALADQPPWRWFQDDPTRQPNPDFPSAVLTAGQARLYADQVAEGWARIAPLAAAAPADQSFRMAAAGAMGARGWPWRAAAETEIAVGLNPDALGARIALVELALSRYRFNEAEARIAALLAIWPENRAVQRLAIELDAQRRFVFEIEARPGRSDGGGENASGDTREVEARLYSPPIAENYRLFAMFDNAVSHPPEGSVQRDRLGFGLEYRQPQFRATAFATQSFGTLSDPGFGATLDWQPVDTWRFGLAAERFSASSPLRALRYGITSDEVSARATWRRDESLSIGVSAAYQPFSDGNRRTAGGLEARALVIDLPHFDVTARGDLYTSANTRNDGPYFAPRSDFTATGGVMFEHVTWRRYENSFVQALTIDAGSYSQQGYGTGWVGTAAYEHRWRFDPMTEFRYGIQATRRIYDGDVERGIALIIALTQRL
jgi:biofilm PGA synthesis protein PgaA